MKPEPVVLVYDDECPVCRRAVDWVRRRAVDPDAFGFLPCRSAETRSRFPGIEEAECMKAIHIVLPSGTVLAGERALPEILSRLRNYRSVSRLFRLPGAEAVSRFLYRAFARRRHLFG